MLGCACAQETCTHSEKLTVLPLVPGLRAQGHSGAALSLQSSNPYVLPTGLTMLTPNRLRVHSEGPMETHFQYKANRRSYCGVLLADRYSIPKSNLSNPILVIQISFTFLLISFNFFFFPELCSWKGAFCESIITLGELGYNSSRNGLGWFVWSSAVKSLNTHTFLCYISGYFTRLPNSRNTYLRNICNRAVGKHKMPKQLVSHLTQDRQMITQARTKTIQRPWWKWGELFPVTLGLATVLFPPKPRWCNTQLWEEGILGTHRRGWIGGDSCFQNLKAFSSNNK